MSESLIENEHGHSLVFSEIRLDPQRRVVFAGVNSRMPISDREASMKLARREYVTVYQIHDDLGDFDFDFADFALGCTESAYDAGEMFMRFRPDNSHVEKPLFRLNDDVQVLYYITDSRQLILCSNHLAETLFAEAALEVSSLTDRLEPLQKFQFETPVIFDFAMSGFDNFIEYLQALGALQ